MKLLLFLAVSLVLFAGIVLWPTLRSDWDYWSAKRAYKKLHVGDTKEHVQDVFGKPPLTEYSDRCWIDTESHWPGGQRVYTLCFDHGKLASKTFEDD